MNVLDEGTLKYWENRILAGHFDFVFFGTPCETFSRVRHVPGGPPPLRSWEEPLGMDTLSPLLRTRHLGGRMGLMSREIQTERQTTHFVVQKAF